MDKLNVLIIGAGNIGALFDTPDSVNILTHAHAFCTHKAFSLIGFVDNDYSKAKKAAELWNCIAFENIEQAFHHSKIDIVCVAVPDAIHYSLLKQLLNYQIKLVFAEKPITKTLEQAEEIIDLYKKKNIPILLNYSRRFVPEYQQIKENICSMMYGKFTNGNFYYGKGISHNGSHAVDFLRFLIGEISSFQVFNRIFDFYEDDPSVSAVLNFKDAGSLMLQSVNCNNYTIFEADLLFEKKRFRFTDSGFNIEEFDVVENKIFNGYKNIVKVEEYPVTFGNSLYYAADNIFKYLNGQESLKCTVNDGYKALEICCKLKEN